MVGKLSYKPILKLLLSLTIITLLCLSFFVFPSSANNQYEVGVFYFTNWNPELNPTAIKNYEKIYGRSNDYWGGVKDHLTQAGPWGDGPIPYREPLAGWYDDRQQSVIDQQILQASSRGIDHFAFYYYWKDAGGGERPGQQAIYNFTTSPYKDLMKFYLYFVADGQWAASDWDSLIIPKLVNFMKDSSYKRTPDGRPIVGFYGDMLTRLGGAANLKTALEHLRTAAQQAGLPNPLLVVNGFRTLKTYTENYGYDGFLPLNLAGIGLDSHPYVPEDYATSYPQAWNNFVYASYSPESGYENYENYLFIPGGLSAFDPRPWGKGKDKYVYADPSPSKFRVQLTNIKNYLDTHPRSMNISTIYAWNENGEGGTIEPTTMDGYGYLNAIQETFGLNNSAYKQKIQQLQLRDLDPGLRLELSPENAFGADEQIIKLKGRVSNRNTEPISSLQLTLSTGGWNIVASSGTTIDNLAPGASQDVEFQVQIGEGELWTKHMLHVSAEGSMGQQNLIQTVSTFLVKTPEVYGVIEPVLQSVLRGDVVDLQVNVRNYSQIEQSGNYSVVVPSGWFISENGNGNFSLSGNTGSIQYNRKISKVFNLCVPSDTPNGQYEVKLLLTSGGATTEYRTYVTVGNYMVNGSFETDSNNDGLADSWSKTNTNTTVSASNDAAEGTKSQKISYTGYGAGIKQEWFNVQPNKEYIIEAWVKVESGKIRIEEDEADAKYVFLGANAYKDVTGNTWQKVALRYTPKTNASKMSIRFLTWSALPTVAYIDNVQFYSVSSVPVTGITLDKGIIDMNVGEIQTATAEIIPSNAVYKKLAFSSSNSQVAEITGTYYDSTTGKTTVTFKAAGIGTAQLTATSLEGLKTAGCDINVYPVIQQVTISPIKELLKTGENQQLELVVTMSDGSQAVVSPGAIAYSTDNPLVAQVDPNGLITAIGDGTATIKTSVTIRGVTMDAETKVSVDGTPPVTTGTLYGTLRDDGTYNSNVSLTLAADDGNGSGMDKTLYSIDGSEWLNYQSPVEFVKNGIYSISFKSADKLGNEEITKTIELSVQMDADVMTGYLLNSLNSLEIQQGIKNSLTSKLDNVLDSLKKDNKKSAANQLRSFINEVEAQNSKELTAQQAVQLKLEAESIIKLIQ